MTIGERIKKVRKEAKLTQTEFAKKLCCTYGAISMIQRNENLPSQQTKHLICKCYSVNRLWLQQEIGEQYYHNESAAQIIDEKLENGSEFSKVLFRSLAEMSDEELLVIEKLFLTIQDQLKKPDHEDQAD